MGSLHHQKQKNLLSMDYRLRTSCSAAVHDISYLHLLSCSVFLSRWYIVSVVLTWCYSVAPVVIISDPICDVICPVTCITVPVSHSASYYDVLLLFHIQSRLGNVFVCFVCWNVRSIGICESIFIEGFFRCGGGNILPAFLSIKEPCNQPLAL